METRTPHWRAVLTPVTFALACVALMIATWVAFGGTVPLAAQGYRIYLPLPQGTGVYPGTSIRVAGITVGKVIGVAPAGRDGARVLTEIQDQYAPVRDGATAIVRSKTLLGEAYIEMAPGPPRDPVVLDGGSLPAGSVVETQQLTDVLRIFTPAVRGRIRSMFDGLAAAGRGRSEALGDVLGNSGPTATSLAAVANTLNQQRGGLQQLIDDTGTVLAALGSREGVIRSAVTAGDAVLQVTAQREAALRATIEALPPFLNQTHAASVTLGTATGAISAGVNALNLATPQLVPALHAVIDAAPTIQALFTRLPATLSAGERNLPAVGRVLAAARPAFAVLYTALRNLIPIIQLTSDVRDSVVGSVANVGSINNGTIDVPGLGQTHFASGGVTVWNETVGGWVKRLPTNRANPYPAPGSENDIAHGGLRSYDCRNTDNILYLPPTGTGSPPCIQQGPWTFDGKSAFYPRLQLAPP
jgi:phospholipid/cholesterol/gamma-HCH transport system substrate-binding protein